VARWCRQKWLSTLWARVELTLHPKPRRDPMTEEKLARPEGPLWVEAV
jgi:hypothetical protein